MHWTLISLGVGVALELPLPEKLSHWDYSHSVPSGGWVVLEVARDQVLGSTSQRGLKELLVV